MYTVTHFGTLTMVHYKLEYAHPDKRFFNGTRFNVVKVKRHRIHPARIAKAVSLWQVIVESLMERYPWVVIENVTGWIIYKYEKWSMPRFAISLASTGKKVAVPIKQQSSPSWLLLKEKKAQK